MIGVSLDMFKTSGLGQPWYVLDKLSLLLLSTPLHQRAANRVQHPNHVAANSLSPQVARKGSTLSGFVQRSRLEREVGRDLHSNKWEEV